MDNAVALVQAYLHVNGYFTVAEYPVLESLRHGGYRSITDLDILAFRFAGAGRPMPSKRKGEIELDREIYRPDSRSALPPIRPICSLVKLKKEAPN